MSPGLAVKTGGLSSPRCTPLVQNAKGPFGAHFLPGRPTLFPHFLWILLQRHKEVFTKEARCERNPKFEILTGIVFEFGTSSFGVLTKVGTQKRAPLRSAWGSLKPRGLPALRLQLSVLLNFAALDQVPAAALDDHVRAAIMFEMKSQLFSHQDRQLILIPGTTWPENRSIR